MVMLDIQRRHATVFRIRFGDKTSSGAPRKLTDRIRVTAPNAMVIDAFTEACGGERRKWEGQYEAYLPVTSLPIMVLPGQSITQFWERYRGSVCERRCEGWGEDGPSIEQKSGKPCVCPEDVAKRVTDKAACSPTTRVSIICPDVAVVGAGMLVSHGLIAAETLPQAIAVAEAALSRGLMVPAMLRVVEYKGRTHFIVPQIEIVGVSLNELSTGEARLSLAKATDPVPPSAPAFKPVPVQALPPGPQPTVAEQVEGINTPAPRPARKNAQTPLPSTGRKPRPLRALPEGDDKAPPADKAPQTAAQHLAMLCREADVDRARLVAAISEGRTESARDLSSNEMAMAMDAVAMLRSGAWVLIPRAGRYMLEATGEESGPARAAVEPAATEIPAATSSAPAPTSYILTSGMKAGQSVDAVKVEYLRWMVDENPPGIADEDKAAARTEIARREGAE